MKRSSRRKSAQPAKPSRRGNLTAEPGETGLKIGEAAKLLGEKPFVLRFWETEFPFLKAGHTRYKHRVYHAADIENLRLIKRLLHEERFTIEGAKKHLREHGLERVKAELAGGAARPTKAAAPARGTNELREQLGEIRQELSSLHKLLED